MRQHRTKRKSLIGEQSTARYYAKGRVVFCIAENGFLRAATIMKQNHAFGCLSFVGNNDLVIEYKIPGLKQIQLNRAFVLSFGFFACEYKSIASVP